MTNEQRNIRLLTFNVHGEQDAPVQKISQFIIDSDADIVCLQEHRGIIQLDLPEYVLMSIGYAEKTDIGSFLSNAIFVKKKLLYEQTSDVARCNMFFPPDSRKSVPRSCAVVYLEGITIANIHQTGGCGDDLLYKELVDTKGKQMERMIRAFKPDIILGDLNAESNEADARDQMKNYRFYQTLSMKERDIFMNYYLCGHRKLDEHGYMAAYQVDDVRPTSVYGGVPDWIYFKESKISVVSFNKLKAIPNFSDHNAILITINVKK